MRRWQEPCHKAERRGEALASLPGNGTARGARGAEASALRLWPSPSGKRGTRTRVGLASANPGALPEDSGPDPMTPPAPRCSPVVLSLPSSRAPGPPRHK